MRFFTQGLVALISLSVGIHNESSGHSSVLSSSAQKNNDDEPHSINQRMMSERSGMFDVSAIDDDDLESVTSLFEQDIPTTRKDTSLSSCGWLLGYVQHCCQSGGLLGSGDGGEVIGCGHGKMGDGITLGDVVVDGLGVDATENNSSQGGVGLLSNSTTDFIVGVFYSEEGGNPLQNFESANEDAIRAPEGYWQFFHAIAAFHSLYIVLYNLNFRNNPSLVSIRINTRRNRRKHHEKIIQRWTCAGKSTRNLLLRRVYLQVEKRMCGGCLHCGEKFCNLPLRELGGIDLHHVIEEKKLFNPSEGVLKTFDKSLKENRKLVPLCKRCHLHVHHMPGENDKFMAKLESTYRVDIDQSTGVISAGKKSIYTNVK
eukprot:scaffold20550_cov232-Skeletonema_marinoi.AAC.2